MKIAIIGAMEEEVKLISEMLEEKEVKLINGYTFEVGKLFGKDIILTVSSIGKVATGLLMGTLFSNFKNVDKVINVGIAGGVMGKVKPGDVVVSEKLCYSDADAIGFGYEYGQIPGCPLYYYGDEEMISNISVGVLKGLVLTADIFQTDKNCVEKIINDHFKGENVLAFDMESTAFAQCAYKNNVGFLAIRAISDVIGCDNQFEKYEDDKELAVVKARDALVGIVKKL